jgi:acyl dehydratase
MRRFSTPEDMFEAAGEHLGFGSWREITQEHIDQFANATGDHQWIHVDPVRAAAGPFGATIAHGWMTLSLVAGMEEEIFHVDNVSMIVNSGADHVRFLAPVPVGSKVRVGAELTEVVRRPDGVRTVMRMTVEIQGRDRPACIADVVTVLFDNPQ